MSIHTKWRNHIQEHKTLFTMVALGIFLLELEIFAMAALRSGPQTRLQILDAKGNVLYAVKGNHLDDQAREQFEKTFGPLAGYQVNLVTHDRPFPFRAWFAAAVGLPVGVVLLFGFTVRVYEALFIDRGKKEAAPHCQDVPTGRMDRLITRISRFNVFVLGALVLIFAVGLWAVPYMLVQLGRQSVDIITRYKWVVLGAMAVFLSLVIWIIYLRYRLAGKAIQSQAEVEKYRLELEILGRAKGAPQLPAPEQGKLEAPGRVEREQ